MTGNDRANDNYLISRWKENKERMLAIIRWLRKCSVSEDYSTQVWIKDNFTCTADGSGREAEDEKESDDFSDGLDRVDEDDDFKDGLEDDEDQSSNNSDRSNEEQEEELVLAFDSNPDESQDRKQHKWLAFSHLLNHHVFGCDIPLEPCVFRALGDQERIRVPLFVSFDSTASH